MWMMDCRDGDCYSMSMEEVGAVDTSETVSVFRLCLERVGSKAPEVRQ